LLSIGVSYFLLGSKADALIFILFAASGTITGAHYCGFLLLQESRKIFLTLPNRSQLFTSSDSSWNNHHKSPAIAMI